jgi:fructokinase
MAIGFRIGVDLGGTKIEAAAIDTEGRIRARRRVATPTGDYAATIAAVEALVRAIDAELGGHLMVGVGIPGTLVARTGLVKNANSTC